MSRIFRSIDGVLLFDKPLHLSSSTALQKIRHLFQANKAGHTGTLDPLATGLLPVCFGEATKFSNALLNADKAYRATLRLGQITTTGDAEGEIIAEHPVDCRQADIEAVLQKFRGTIQQLPPMHSALKHQGKPLYEYIRQGETVERASRSVVIHELVLTRFEGRELPPGGGRAITPSSGGELGWGNNEMDITVRCSKGTYIRTLAEDIGAALGCGAHLSALRRTAVAHFDLDGAYTLKQLEVMAETARDACILPLESLMPDIPILQLDSAQIHRLAQGQRLALDTGLSDGKVRLHGPQGFIGVGLLQGRRLAPERLLAGGAQAGR